jgi:hypothetical protein
MPSHGMNGQSIDASSIYEIKSSHPFTENIEESEHEVD